MFDRLIHADWSVDPGKRWKAQATRQDQHWNVDAPTIFGPTCDFIKDVFGWGEYERILIGFDFPIGLPYGYGNQTELHGFKAAILAFGEGKWENFFNVAKEPEDVSIYRPFYPYTSRKGVKRDTLTIGLNVPAFDALLRVCERQNENRRAACALFWTLGGNQVGKAAITGWQEIVRPALERGVKLWPFDGTLAELANAPGVVINETYPAEAYRMADVKFGRNESKRRQMDRKAKAKYILQWATEREINLSDKMRSDISEGFGENKTAEDRFDALMGLVKMIEVADGRRRETSGGAPCTTMWEGWILGR